jgi:RsiW-degrading membrane proteinase PrsW (M82 family)
MKRIFILLILSVAVATALFYVNSNVIQSDLQDKLSEIGVITIPVFIVLSLFYYVNRAIIKKVRGTGKKKPSV